MMVETMKRRERERILAEITVEMDAEKAVLLAAERKKMEVERETAAKAEEILLQNKLKMEEQQRKEFEAKQQQNADRLLEIQRRQKAEVRIHFLAVLPSKIHTCNLGGLAVTRRSRSERSS